MNTSPLSLHLILEKNHILEPQTCVQTFKSSSGNAFLIMSVSLPLCGLVPAEESSSGKRTRV